MLADDWPGASLPQSVKSPLLSKPFPISVTSELNGDLSRVAISALVPVTFTELANFYRDDSQWCQAFFANVYVKSCYKNQRSLRLFYNNNDRYQDLEAAFRFDYRIETQQLDPTRLYISLIAASGPLGSFDYQLNIEAQAANAGNSFIRLVYQARYGWLARSAVYVYLKTLGGGKVGFSHDQDNKPVEGLRGVLERNAMRYLLALSAYFTNHESGKPYTVTLKNWHDYAQVFQDELQEIDWNAYQSLKTKEYGDLLKLEKNRGELWVKDDW